MTVKCDPDSLKPSGKEYALLNACASFHRLTFHPDSALVAVKVKKILSTLSSFEEASAECISNMLIKFSNLDYLQGSVQASLFINYMESLFFSIQSMDELSTGVTNTVTGPSSSTTEVPSLAFQTREAKQLSKRIVYFLSLLSSTRDSATRDANTKEMISVVTSLAYSLKLVLRGALVWASYLVSLFSSSIDFPDHRVSCAAVGGERTLRHDTAIHQLSRVRSDFPKVWSRLCFGCQCRTVLRSL